MFKILTALVIIFSATQAFAQATENTNTVANGPNSLSTKLANFNGYTIVGSKLIIGYNDGDTFKKGFTGCKKGMTIKFADSSTLICDSDLRDTFGKDSIGVILTKDVVYGGAKISVVKMVVKDSVFDMDTSVQKFSKK